MEAPVRRLIKPTTPRTVHLLNLRGVLPHPVQAEATTESAFVQVAALCPATRSIASQPETIQLPGRTYTPDYRVEAFDGGTSIWEVKLEARIPKYRALFDIVARQLADRSIQFFVISEKSLRRQRQHQDVRLILRYAKGHFLPADVSKVLEHLLGHPEGATIKALVSRLSVTRELLFHLVAKRAITFAGAIRSDPNSCLIHIDYLEQKNAFHLARWLGVSPWRTNV
ncbi:hypothetical protein PEC18_29495 [Paucibacter sp. O1-1]|nr:Tn7 transposase TnsA N-terminal domain-containing protein [Paucibacter sp. O1-1]MDA3829876.1 hypothetical protein [Paucibacter sp. O1-1]